MARRARGLLTGLGVACLLTLSGCGGHAAPAVPVAAGSVRTVEAALLNVLTCPSQTCSVVEDLHAGDKVALLSPEVDGWYQIRVLADGREGFVLARFLGR